MNKYSDLIPEVKIVNKRRKKQLDTFIDKNHPGMIPYYDLLEEDMSDSKRIIKLQKLILDDADFFDPYITLADIYEAQGKQEEARKLITTGFKKAMKKIVDHQGSFPKELPWGYLENRHLIRIIYQQALDCWTLGDTQAALYLLRRLLRSNPNDNIGARNDILAIRMELGLDYLDQFITPETLPGYIDAHLSLKWFDKHSKKFPDEFEWWRKEVEEE